MSKLNEILEDLNNYESWKYVELKTVSNDFVFINAKNNIDIAFFENNILKLECLYIKDTQELSFTNGKLLELSSNLNAKEQYSNLLKRMDIALSTIQDLKLFGNKSVAQKIRM